MKRMEDEEPLFHERTLHFGPKKNSEEGIEKPEDDAGEFVVEEEVVSGGGKSDEEETPDGQDSEDQPKKQVKTVVEALEAEMLGVEDEEVEENSPENEVN